VPTWQEWTAEESAGGKTVGVDPSLIGSSTAEKLDEKIKQSGGSGLEAVLDNLVDLVWGEERPAKPSESVVLLAEKYAGMDTKAKLADLRKEVEKKKARGFVVSMLDEIAWLFNLRGNDIPYNPVFFSYAIVTPDNATLYVDSAKLSDEAKSYLSKNSVMVRPYEAFFDDLKRLVASMQPYGESAAPAVKFLISTRASWALKLALGGKNAEEIRSPVGDAKAVKNETELEGMRQCHIRDGAALSEYFAWLEDQLLNKGAKLDEVQGADKLEEIRKKQKDFVGLSFDTISSTGAKYVQHIWFVALVDLNANMSAAAPSYITSRSRATVRSSTLTPFTCVIRARNIWTAPRTQPGHCTSVRRRTKKRGTTRSCLRATLH
jgi:Xaa-Pro aminopeptidase